MVSALPPSETVAVIGVGTMGAGIAQVAAVAGNISSEDAKIGGITPDMLIFSGRCELWLV